MDTYRNGIYVSGLAEGADLPKSSAGQVVHYSEVENICIPPNEPDINKIVRASISVRVTAKKIVMTPYGYLIILDGVRDLILNYIPVFEPQKVNQLKMELPYHAFTEIPSDHESFDQIKVFIMDACFNLQGPKLLNGFFIYSLFVPVKIKMQEDMESPVQAPSSLKPASVPPEYPQKAISSVSRKDGVYDKVINEYFQSFDNDMIFKNKQP